MNCRPITDYDLVTKFLPVNLVGAINNAITEGWHPLGGVSVSVNVSGQVAYTQAIVKYGVER